MTEKTEKKGFKYHWRENILPLLCFFLTGFMIAAGFIAAEWVIPQKPKSYQICIKDSNEDYMCKTYG